ncbi:MAG TPA: hypothetical protein VGI95_14825 [Caulobacteraceae bacterium]|jgi:hypothetical protein
MPQIETLGRIMNSPADVLTVTCGGCGHAATFPRAEAWRVWGMGATPNAIRRRAKCALCGGRRVEVTI